MNSEQGRKRNGKVRQMYQKGTDTVGRTCQREWTALNGHVNGKWTTLDECRRTEKPKEMEERRRDVNDRIGYKRLHEREEKEDNTQENAPLIYMLTTHMCTHPHATHMCTYTDFSHTTEPRNRHAFQGRVVSGRGAVVPADKPSERQQPKPNLLNLPNAEACAVTPR